MWWDKDRTQPNYAAFYRDIMDIINAMERGGVPDAEIAAYVLQVLYDRGLTIQQFEDWKAGRKNR